MITQECERTPSLSSLVHELCDESVLSEYLAPEDGVEAGDVLVLGVSGHQLRHHGLVPLGHLQRFNMCIPKDTTEPRILQSQGY